MKISLDFERLRRDSDLWKEANDIYTDEIREIETRGLWKTLEKVYNYLRLDSEHKLEDDFYIFSDPVITAEVKDIIGGGGQGCGSSFTEYFTEQGEMLGEMWQKPNICGLKLTASLGETVRVVCADPRIVSTDIFVNWLALGYRPPNTEAELLASINAALKPTFSFDEAFEFLEKNRFIGEDSKKNVVERDVRAGKTTWSDRRNVWIWEGVEFPGWWTRDALKDTFYVPSRMRGVYDKFRAAYLEYEEEQRKEREKRSAFPD